MVRRRGDGDGSVRGPTSALTSFLAGLGVQPQPRQADADAEGSGSTPDQQAGPSSPRGSPPEDVDSDDLDDRPTKRRAVRAASIDSDDLDATPAESSAGASGATTPTPNKFGAVLPGKLKGVGEFMHCGECAQRFTVTTYTKEHPKRARTYLCTKCCPKLGIDPFAKEKKPRGPKKAPPPKRERGKVIHYEVTKGATPLADMCIAMIGKYIEEVDALGDIGTVNLDKVCKIISKSRRLTPETATLLYSAERQELAMYDCTLLVHDSFVTLAKLCPNLVKINLQQCGQMMTDTLIAWGKSLKKLRELELDAPFLVRKEGWISFFKAIGKRLEVLRITQSPRIDLEVIKTLVKHCPNVRELRLADIGLLDGEFLEALGSLQKLKSLEIIAPKGPPLSDEAIDQLLEAVGENLTHLDLSDNPELGDPILLSIATHCPNLRQLSLRNNDLSDHAVSQFFQTLADADRPPYTHLDLEKGHDLSQAALRAIIAHSGRTIEHLSLMGWRTVPAKDVSELATCPKLQSLNLGWCRHVTDFTLKDLLDGCESLQEIRVWGCNQLSDRVPRKRGVKVIGIETHAI